MEFAMRKALRRTGLLVAMIMAGLSVTIALTSALTSLELIPARSLLAGATFVPPLFCALLGFAAALALISLGYRPGAWGLVLLQSAYFAAFGDYSLRSLGPTTEPTDSWRLKAVALNVQYFTEGVPKIADYLARLEPDVMLLSEAEGDAKTRKAFTQALAPYDIRYAAKGDTAIASRHPIIEFYDVVLPSFQPSLSGFNLTATQYRNPRRTFVHAVIDVHGTRINVLSVRLIAGRGRSHAPIDQWHWGRFLMREQAREVSTFVRYVKQLQGPVLFGGDLNATSSSISILKLNEIADDAYLNTHVWGDFTFKTKLLPMQKHKNLPALRLDYLFVRNGLLPQRVDVLDGNVSDHFPVMGEFALLRP